MVVNLAVWLASLQALLPPGRAFTRHPDSVFTKVLLSIAAMLLAAQLWLEDMLYQADPRNATSMLPRWEEFLNLPDKCTPAGQQLIDRQRAAYQRLLEQGGQSRAYFIELGSLLGEPNVTITEFKRFTCNSTCNDALRSDADCFVWQVNIPHGAQNIQIFNCNSPCDSSLQSYSASVIECAFKERRPAHTDVIFAYQS
ncbi:MAG: DUF2313 domain-containing protein [Rhodoferax sp.]|nr:DUF2313 domain-containing protein [Rhodoferax sp.]